MVHICNPSTQGAESGRSGLETRVGYIVSTRLSKSLSQKKKKRRGPGASGSHL
jgi:hypothetical protein